MESLLDGDAQLPQPHALPFRAIFEEHLRRDAANLLRKAQPIFMAANSKDALAAVKKEIKQQEAAYEDLAAANVRISEGCTPCKSLDELTADCKDADASLKRLLHSIEASALCLSGGGIRSASFSLGVLEGLSRFSDSRQGPDGLMYGLHYLSTVSGGGYIGSWFTSWVQRVGTELLKLSSSLIDQLADCRTNIARIREDLKTLAACAKEMGREAQDLDNKAKALLKEDSVSVELIAAIASAFDDLNAAQVEIAQVTQDTIAVSVIGERLRSIDKHLESADNALNFDKSGGANKTVADCRNQITACREKIAIPTIDEISGKLKALPVCAKDMTSKAEGLSRRCQRLSIQCGPRAAALHPSTTRALAELKEAEAEIARIDQTAGWVPLEGQLASADRHLQAAEDALKKAGEFAMEQAYAEIISAIAGEQPVTSGDAEPPPVRHLRAYTSYLAPSMGFTLDTFTLVAIVSRNLLVNWVMVIPVLLAMISFFKITGFGSAFLESRLQNWMPETMFWNVSYGQFILGSVAAILLLLAALAAAFSLPSHYKVLAPSARRASVWIFVTVVVLASWILTIAQSATPLALITDPSLRLQTGIALLGFGTLAASVWLAYKARIQGLDLGKRKGKIGAALMGLLVTVLISLLTDALLLLTRHSLYKYLLWGGDSSFLQRHGSDDRLFIVFALPLTLVILMSTTSLFCALMGVFEMEEDREWWVRCGAAFFIFSVVWIVGHAIAFYAQGVWQLVMGASGLLLGLLGSLVGSSGVTAAGPRPVKTAQLTKVGKFLEKHNLVLPVVGGLSLCLIGLGIADVEESIRRAIQASVPGEFYSASVLFLISAIFAVLINFAINVNLFSLQGMYRMRLMRAFLGGSNVFRRPDPFTNFDPNDTPYEKDLPVCRGVPLHVINATLNLTGTKNTAWKQRRAESFTFSPVQCGGWRAGYVSTDCYGGARGVTLATAMSISGAAFNPNMGYQSSPVLSLLMTFFNLRLGSWLPNPKRPTPKLFGTKGTKFFRKSGPTCALQPLVAEALGNTDDEYRWIELTDGGHFENLGLYEMVMRRCKNIIVVDAGADPLCQFEDLGNAIRKIQIDLGIPIVFPGNLSMRKGLSVTNSYCAVARIHYHCADALPPGVTEDEFDGWLVYIKAGLTGEEPADILQYAKTHPTFPNETTGNQFFTESQFESYRHLGSYIVSKIAAAAPQPHPPIAETITFAAFVKAAQNYWSSKSPDGMHP